MIILVLIPEEYLFISFLPRFYSLFIIVHYVFICGPVHMSAGAPRHHKKVWDTVELELWIILGSQMGAGT